MARRKLPEFGVTVGGKVKHFGVWQHESGKYQNFRTMFDNARSAITDFEKTKADILANENLSDRGKEKALDKALADFDQLHQRWMRGPVADRLPMLDRELRALRGGKPREKDDVAGQISDREDRDWFKSLQGDEKTALIGAMLRGEEPEITAAVLRKGDLQMGLRPGLREQLQAVAVEPHNVEFVAELQSERAAIVQAVEAFETSKVEILGMAEREGVVSTIPARDALEAEGLQKAADGKTVEPFVEPEVEPFPTDKDGVIDLDAERNWGAA